MIDFVIENWLVFLISTFIFFSCGVSVQLFNMKRVIKNDNFDDKQEISDIFKGVAIAMIFGFFSIISAIFFIISIILNAIQHFRA